LFEARNAVRIAHIAAADKYAPSIISKADDQLRQAESAYRSKQNKTSIEAAAREAAQTAEEARVMSVKQKAEDEVQAQAAAEKKAADERAAKARAEAEEQAKARAEADAARVQAEAAKAEAQKAAAEAARQKQEAEQAKAEALAQQQALAAEADKARQAAAQSDQLRQQAEKEKQELRARLLQQLNTVLATRDSARGLIANMSDVLFKSGSFELLAGARERLAKVSGIVLAYPSLRLSVEGHTDSVGTDDYNQQLSERRAEAVRDYFVQQGISSEAVIASGFGKTAPVASNDTPEGRQQNRRVEIVLSGDAIGSLGDQAPSETASSKQ
jgi:outer membrane protein OmpA-like peptidoglycan-associated protein